MTHPVRNSRGVVEALYAACAAHPSQRAMQVVVNCFGTDPFYVEDADAIRRLNEYAAGRTLDAQQPGQ